MNWVHIICLTTLVTIPATAQNAPLLSMVQDLTQESDYAASNQAFSQLWRILKSSDDATLGQARTALIQEYTAAEDPRSIQRIGRVLGAAPCNQFLLVSLEKLASSSDRMHREAVCAAIAGVGSGFEFADRDLVESAVIRFTEIARGPDVNVRLLDSALLAMSSLGSTGLEGLLTLRFSAGIVTSRSNVFYTALARTGDLRALAVLCDTLTDQAIREGLRIQAARGIEQLAGKGVSPASQDIQNCVQVLNAVLGSTDSDCLVGASLKALARFQGTQPNAAFYDLALTMLHSGSRIRQEAAMEAMYLADCGNMSDPLAQELLLIAHSEDPGLSALAQAVLDRCEVENEAALPQD